jgi:hypothetical protein
VRESERERGREGGRDGGREGGREEGREGGRESGTEGGRERDVIAACGWPGLDHLYLLAEYVHARVTSDLPEIQLVPL